MAAPRIHWTPLGRKRRGQVLRSIVRVLADSNRIDDILLVEELTAQVQLKHLVDQRLFDDEEGQILLKDRPSIADLDFEEMHALPEGTLGQAWADFFVRNKLDPHTLDPEMPYTHGEDEAWILQRLRHTHDLWHVLLGLETQGHEEVLIHAFSLGQSGLPASIAIIFFGTLKHIVGEGRWKCLRQDLRAAYRRGRDADRLIPVYWERHLERPLAEVRSSLHLTPMGV